jgi:hypothetical protein
MNRKTITRGALATAVLGGTGLALVLAGAGTANAASLGGTWSRDLPCTTTQSTHVNDPVINAGHQYAAQVQQPINPDNTSVWPAKRGVIPVQFKVTDTLVTTTSTTTDTTSTEHGAFESINGAADHTGWSYLGFVPSAPLTVGQITNLSADFTWQTGDNHGGGLRWALNTPSGQIEVYYGDASNSLQGSTDGSGANLLATGENRVEASQLGKPLPLYDTWANVKSLYGNLQVTSVALLVDGGWGGTQVLDVSSLTVNDNTNVDPLADVTSTTSSTVVSNPVPGTPVQTNTPAATLKLDRIDATGALGAIDESLTSAQGDSGGHFRQVDGKYIYNLDAAGLGVGKYVAHIVIGGTVVETPGVFGLK